ncbi:MAG: TIM barrel protein, partial [Acidobacteria bacterium]|nr:TIM barrel protein [Acidobacteriota bacterium]
VTAGFHNHASYIGGPIWDFAPFIEAMDARWAGYYFDPRHTFAEGGAGAWKSALLHIAPRIKMMAVKDFYWEKTAKGWQVKDCPLGEGMVDWKFVCKALAQANFHGPISMHIEYEIAGKTNAEKDDNTLAAAVRDLAFLKARLAEAYV